MIIGMSDVKVGLMNVKKIADTIVNDTILISIFICVQGRHHHSNWGGGHCPPNTREYGEQGGTKFHSH